MSTDIVSLAAQITCEHEAACRAVRSGLEHGRRAGDLLLAAKAGLEHGAWLPWLTEHCPTLPARTAQAYMRIARRWPELEQPGADAQRVADLPIRQALALLAAPTVHRLVDAASTERSDDVDDRHPWDCLAAHLDALCDDADADAVELARLQVIIDRPIPKRPPRSVRLALVRDGMAVMEELRQLERRASERRLQAERAVGLLLTEVAAEGWTWPRAVLAMGEEMFEGFLLLCEGRFAEGAQAELAELEHGMTQEAAAQ